MQRGRRAEDQPSNLWRTVWIDSHVGQSFQDRLERGPCLEPGQVNAQADVRAVGEGEVTAVRVGSGQPPGIEPVGVGEHRGVAVRGADRDADELAFSYLRVAYLGVGCGVAIDDRGG